MPRRISQKEFLSEFRRITEQMCETAERKNSDYTGDGQDAFKNFTMVSEMGAASVDQGFFTRMNDKMMRFAGFIRTGTLKVSSEKIEDTVLDLAVYCIIYVCYRRSQESEEKVCVDKEESIEFQKKYHQHLKENKTLH